MTLWFYRGMCFITGRRDLLELISPSVILSITMLAEILAIWQQQLVWLQLAVASRVNSHTLWQKSIMFLFCP